MKVTQQVCLACEIVCGAAACGGTPLDIAGIAQLIPHGVLYMGPDVQQQATTPQLGRRVQQ